jgi:uncharacterized protein
VSELADEFTRLAKLLVDHPEAVRVTEVERRRMQRLELRVAPEDLGNVIGRQGRTARALRALLDARAARHGEQYGLEILED